MPRNGAGVYSKTFAAIPGQPISSSAVNAQLDDIATALTG